MGCYGLGVTRILAASIEVLSTEQEIQWPSLIAPYQVYVIPPKVNCDINFVCFLYSALTYSIYLQGMWDYVSVRRPTPFT